MTDIRNPAHRLHTALDALKKANRSIPLSDTLPVILRTGDSLPALYRSIAELISLSTTTADSLSSVAGRLTLAADNPQFRFYTRWQSNVEVSMSLLFNLAQATATVADPITDGDMASLEAAAYWSTPHIAGTEPSSTDLDELRLRADELHSAILATDALPEQLRVALALQLRRIIDALDRAWLIGASEVHRASDEAYGAIIRTLVDTGAPDNPEGRSLLQRAGRIVTAVALIGGAVGGVLALPTQAAEAWQVFTGIDALPAAEEPAAVEGTVDE